MMGVLSACSEIIGGVELLKKDDAVQFGDNEYELIVS
jgi:hypothetical protein